MENKEDKEKIDNKLQTELLVEIEKHERRVLDVLDRLSKKSDEDLPAEFKDASIVLASATKELKELTIEHEKNKEVYENLIDTISKRVSTIPEEFVKKYLQDFPTKFELNKPDWWKEYPKQKEWLTARDKRVCPWCDSMEGKVLNVRGSYFAQGDSLTVDGRTINFDLSGIPHPPLHVNCRCDLIPVI